MPSTNNQVLHIALPSIISYITVLQLGLIDVFISGYVGNILLSLIFVRGAVQTALATRLPLKG